MITKLLLSISLILITIYSYITFQSYEPKLLKQIQEIKGVATVKPDTLPYPLDSTKISESITYNTEHITIKTTATYKKVEDFYTNILLEKGWKIESKEINDKFSILNLKKDKQSISIISALEQTENSTIVSIEIVKN